MLFHVLNQITLYSVRPQFISLVGFQVCVCNAESVISHVLNEQGTGYEQKSITRSLHLW